MTQGPQNSRSIFATSVAALAIQFVIQAMLGFLLSGYYTATIQGAHASVEALREDRLWGFLTGFHYWGSQVLILHSFLHLAAMVWTGRYARRAEFLGSAVLFASVFAFQVTGNLLPMDRHDVQTAVIESGIGKGMPVVGEQVGRIMLQGEKFGQATLAGWFEAHRYIVTGLMTFGLLLLLFGRRGRGERPSWTASVAPAAIAMLLAALILPPAGAAATPADFDQQATLVSWYTWPMHGALKAFDSISPGLSWIGAGLVPGFFAAFLAFLAIRGAAASSVLARTGFLLFTLMFLGLAVLFGGPFAPLTGNQDPPAIKLADTSKTKPIDDALARRGQDLFGSLLCTGCHGQGGKGGSAPSLLTVFRKYADADWYKKFIKNPSSVRPGTTMPAFKDLTDDQLAALAEWLRKPK